MVDGSQRVRLCNAWISKASASQRAGRTGRTGPGTVFRLYSKQVFDSMSAHDTPEILRHPLDHVVLSLKAMTRGKGRPVVPMLESTIDPPETSNIDAAFETLYALQLLTAPDDSADLTAWGAAAAQFGADPRLGRLLCQAALLRVLPEAIVMVAARRLRGARGRRSPRVRPLVAATPRTAAPAAPHHPSVFRPFCSSAMIELRLSRKRVARRAAPRPRP